MRKSFRILVMILALVLCVSACTVAFAAPENPTAKLYDIYGDDMLFQQKKEAVFAGTARGGSEITLTLTTTGGREIAKNKTTVSKSDRFEISVPGQTGGYTTYVATLAEDGVEFAKLSNIVFGELWIAGGQSNMQWSLAETITGEKMMEQGQTGSKWIRVLDLPFLPEYKGDVEAFPVDAQRNIPGGSWYCADNAKIYTTSGVAYFFAEKLFSKVHMPVGIIPTAIGGTSIYTWLSRDAIESDAAVKQDLIDGKKYVSVEDWKEKDISIQLTPTIHYNKKFAALSPFRPSGMIWYQGETDLMHNYSGEAYSRAFDLMQRTYSKLFHFEGDALLPIVYTQLASWNYPGNDLQMYNMAFSGIQQDRPLDRAMISLYDIPLTFNPDTGAIHPLDKKPVGERMATAAMALVYDKNYAAYTAATVESAAVKGDSVYVTLRNVGSGLKVKGNTLHGFSVCGKDGIYVGAEAEIVSEDTVRVSSPIVPNPVSAAYAVSEYNGLSNLFATEKGNLAMPVSAFITDTAYSTNLWTDKDWTDCDVDKIWHTCQGDNAGLFDVWDGTNATVAISPYAHSGDGSMRVVCANGKTSRNFSMKLHYLNVNRAFKKERFGDRDTDFRNYGAMTFVVRNDGMTDVSLKNMRLYLNHNIWFTADTTMDGQKIPADGKWHTVTVDLNKLHLFGMKMGIHFTKTILKDVYSLSLQFSGSAGATVLVDDFAFIPNVYKPSPIAFSLEK